MLRSNPVDYLANPFTPSHSTDALRERIAQALGWSLADVHSMSLQSLRELVRTTRPDLAEEISERLGGASWAQPARRRGGR